MSRPNKPARKIRRQIAIDFICDRIGNDCVTTHEVWSRGHQLIAEGVKFPRYTKRSFLSISRVDDLGQILRGHPRFRFDCEIELRESKGQVRRRFRTKLWCRLKADTAQK